LIHNLRQLATTEEEIDRAADALAVDQLRDPTQFVRILQAHALLNGALELEKTLAHFLGSQLIDGSQTTIAQVIDIVNVPFAAAQLEHVFQAIDQILRAEGHDRFRHVLIEFAIDAEPANASEPIAIFIEELFLEERFGFVNLRRIARPEPRVNLHQRVFAAV